MSKINMFPDYCCPAASFMEQKTAVMQKNFYSTVTELVAEKDSGNVPLLTDTDTIIDSIYAETAINSSNDNPAVKISIPIGNDKVKEQTVFIKNIQAGNATMSELFALCFYADSIGIGKDNWNKLIYYSKASIQNGFHKELSSPNEIFSHRQDWNMIIAQTTIHFMSSGYEEQAVFGKELLAVIQYIESLSAAEKENNWRTMSDKSWNKMLESMDDAIDAWKERLKLLRQAQIKAAGEAARRAPAAYQSMAAQAAWNAIALLASLSPASGCNITIAANAAAMANSIEKTELRVEASAFPDSSQTGQSNKGKK